MSTLLSKCTLKPDEPLKRWVFPCENQCEKMVPEYAKTCQNKKKSAKENSCYINSFQ